MLQQTQVGRVIPYYLRFLKKYPTIRSLARARKRTLLRLWSGLGYNSRALRLKELAIKVLKDGKKIPSTYRGLTLLPGIGPYTANAILAFSYNREVPVIDTNIRRVFIHELRLRENIPIVRLQIIAQRAIPKGKSRLWHNALMDYGAMEKTARETGIKPLSSQTPFKGSDRMIRGEIMKRLLSRTTTSFSALKKSFPEKDITKIVRKMEQGSLLRIKCREILLP
ncbi:Fe-S cluster assembly protein HesB [Candidatus Woesearchaeota archaeon]|nr:Fe-S cluster assembly protein HesB [Candidatus Woesearchaeota archaeon]